jgi:hypothetical protein
MRGELQRVTDYFALLNEPRRPWLDPEILKAKFLARSAAVHPDRVHAASAAERQASQQRFVELNAAYTCLREPKERLRHLLELERGEKPEVVQNVPPDLMDQFFEVSRLCREVDAFLQRKAAAISPLLKAQTFEEAQAWAERLNIRLHEVASAREASLAELRALNPLWETDAAAAQKPLLLARLEELYRLLSFYGRWASQLQERAVQLAM